MRALIAVGLVLALGGGTGVEARSFHLPHLRHAQPSERGLVEHGHYENSSHHSVHSPAHTRSGRKPAGASAHCRDGSWSFSEHHSGTCSGHHGVAEWE